MVHRHADRQRESEGRSRPLQDKEAARWEIHPHRGDEEIGAARRTDGRRTCPQEEERQIDSLHSLVPVLPVTTVHYPVARPSWSGGSARRNDLTSCGGRPDGIGRLLRLVRNGRPFKEECCINLMTFLAVRCRTSRGLQTTGPKGNVVWLLDESFLFCGASGMAGRIFLHP